MRATARRPAVRRPAGSGGGEDIPAAQAPEATSVESAARDDRVERLEQRIADLEDDVTLVESQNIALPTTEGLLEILRRELRASLGSMEHRLGEVERLGGRLQSALDAVKRELVARQARPVDERVDEIDRAVIALARRVDAFRDAMVELASDVEIP